MLSQSPLCLTESTALVPAVVAIVVVVVVIVVVGGVGKVNVSVACNGLSINAQARFASCFTEPTMPD